MCLSSQILLNKGPKVKRIWWTFRVSCHSQTSGIVEHFLTNQYENFFVLVSFLSKDFNKVNLITEGGMPIKRSSSLGHNVANDQAQSRWSIGRLILKIYCYNMSIFAYNASFFSWQQSQDSQVNITSGKQPREKGFEEVKLTFSSFTWFSC